MEQLNCLRCAYRHEDNGNCTAVGGFCTAVPAAHCRLLQEYLGTGLTPEDCAEYRKFEDEIIASGKTFGRLIELLKADREGHVVVLPCKVGDTVYSIFGAEIIEKTIGRIIINGYTTPQIWVDLDCLFMTAETKRWNLSVGKDFYLTREEAEEALRRADG